MQAAFLDIGLKRAAFIHAADMLPIAEKTLEPISVDDLDINHFVRPGQEILVQVLKDPLGTKGARMTTRINLPSRYLAYMPALKKPSVSQRIEKPSEQQRLLTLLKKAGAEPEEGFIVRTNTEGVKEIDFEAEIKFLRKLWQLIQDRVAIVKPGGLVFEDLPLMIRALRDQVSLDVTRIRVDDRASFHQLQTFAKEFMPKIKGRIEYFNSNKPIFDLYGIEDEITRVLQPKVALKSGGYLIIEQTEAMTTIDVNTGAFVGARNLDETVFKTNLEAAQAIARQLRLRNLGGIIIIDFIDMKATDHRRQVLRTLEKALERDPVKTIVQGFSALGLVEMTRKRTRESLQHVLCEPCATCSGVGFVKRVDTVCHDIFREIIRSVNAYEPRNYIVLASQDVIDRMLDEESTRIVEFEAQTGSQIKLQTEALYAADQFDVVML
jgi:ribonuclease G